MKNYASFNCAVNQGNMFKSAKPIYHKLGKFLHRKFSSIKILTQHIFVTGIINENFLTE